MFQLYWYVKYEVKKVGYSEDSKQKYSSVYIPPAKRSLQEVNQQG